MQSSESAHALQKTLEFIRFGSIVVLLIHFYATCHPAFVTWGVSLHIADTIIYNLSKGMPWLGGLNSGKAIAIFLLAIAQFGDKGKKDDKLTLGPALYYIIIGLLLYFISGLFLLMTAQETVLAEIYITVTSLGFLSILMGSARLSRLLHLKLGQDIFNETQQTFPQEERLLENEYSINLPAQYRLKGKIRKSWINLVNPFRGTIILGTPGSGKSFFVVRHCITGHIRKGFTMYLYDFKFPDLTRIAYNTALKNMDKYPKPPKFYVINFDDLTRSHRCNVLAPEGMLDLTDATESSRTIMIALNRTWAQKEGEFFTESSINFTTAIFWYLKQYKGGIYCTLPHAIELAQVEYDKLFPVLSLEPQIEVLINPFISALVRGAAEQLEGQIASAKIGLARLSSPSLYYVLSGSDFRLDINNPDEPKIVAVGNNPGKTQIYGAVLSLCTERMLKLVNKKGKLKSSLIFDEFPTIYCGGISRQIATARSNKSATILAAQSSAQLRKDYGKDESEVIMEVAGNIISGQVLGDSARMLSDRIGRIMQERESVSINSNDTSVSRSTQLEAAIPASVIAGLSSGEFVGAVADDPQQKIKHKGFHCEILNDIEAIQKEESEYQDIPVIRSITEEVVMDNYYKVKRDIKRLIDSEMAKIKDHPDMKAAA